MTAPRSRLSRSVHFFLVIRIDRFWRLLLVAGDQAVPRAQDTLGTRISGRRVSSSALRGSYHSGSLSSELSDSAGSSAVKPGSSVAISNRMPPGSRERSEEGRVGTGWEVRGVG